MTANSTYPDMDRERLAVIDNIARAIEEQDTFRKVEPFDPIVTKEKRQRVILPFDTLRHRPWNKIKAFIAEAAAKKETKNRTKDTVIIGIENAQAVSGGAILTHNHFNPQDSTPIRLLTQRCGKGRRLHTVIEESNVFMTGYFGFLMRNCYTLPVSSSPSYMAKNLKPAIKTLLSKGDFLLIYPEEQMWYNYRKPRELRIGAYYFAAENSVPVIPCFTEIRDAEGYDSLGFRNVKYTLHVLPPIYPNSSLSKRECAVEMMEADKRARIDCYSRVYGEYPPKDFVPGRDIGGFWQ